MVLCSQGTSKYKRGKWDTKIPCNVRVQTDTEEKIYRLSIRVLANLINLGNLYWQINLQ